MRLVLAVVMTVAMAGCQYNPNAHLYTTERPTPDDVAGRYVLQEASLSRHDPQDPRIRSCAIELKADGTFIGKQIPLSRADSYSPSFLDTLRSESGTWRIGIVGVVDNGWTRKDVWGVYLDSPSAKLLAANLTGTRAPYGLIFTLGDGDTGQALMLQRAK